MKNIDKKISSLIEVINSMKPDKYFKFKFQDFCMDYFSFDEIEENDEDNKYENTEEYEESEDGESAFLSEEDFQSIVKKVEDCNIIKEGEHKELFTNSFSFGMFIFHSYVDYCLKSAYVGRKNMKRFCEKIMKDYLYKDFPKIVFDYYFYVKRPGNSSVEQNTIAQTETTFPFFKDLVEFQFSFHGPTNNAVNQEHINMIGESIKNSYMCYINTICLSFSNFTNYLNSLRIMDELAQCQSEEMYNTEKKENENG